MPKHLVIVGAGHAHLHMLVQCREFIELGHRVTVVSDSPYHYYSGMGPGLLAGIYRPQDIRFHVRKMAEDRGARFIRDQVIRVDAKERCLHLRSGKNITYDIASFNTGSDVPLPSLQNHGQNVFPVKPIVSLIAAHQAILDRIRKGRTDIVVIGGGPAGLEIAANAWRLVQDRGADARITLIAGKELLRGYPPKLKRTALASLARRGIRVREAVYASRIEKDSILLSSEEKVRADIVLAATGIRPSSMFRDSGIPTGPDGGLLVNAFLQSTAHPEIFGGGDAISFEPRRLAKVGVYAVRQSTVLYRNVHEMLKGGQLTPFKPQHKFMLIFNMGDNRAILTRGAIMLDGGLAWRLKDWIDQSFMKKFQVSGERDEAFAEEEEEHGHT